MNRKTMAQIEQLTAGAVVVTGSCGGIGSELINIFAMNGREIVAISRLGREINLHKNIASSVHSFHANLCKRSSLAGLAIQVKSVLRGKNCCCGGYS